jgi:hypothetical protein
MLLLQDFAFALGDFRVARLNEGAVHQKSKMAYCVPYYLSSCNTRVLLQMVAIRNFLIT